jgi:V8-like Glu-specific endopeptidase
LVDIPETIWGILMFKFLFAALVLSSAQAFALPVATVRPIDHSIFKNAAVFDFEGIVKLSNCSGALIKFEGAPETNKAVIMTNGHCVDLPGGAFIQPGKAIANKTVRRQVGIFDSKKALHKVTTTKYLYATMTGTDVALYELELSYKAIKDQFDIDALTLSPLRPNDFTETQIISGYWDTGYDCSIDGFVPTLKEDAYTWIDSIRYNEECDTPHGSSGSPIIERNTRTVIAINNTGNDSGERCTMDNPCEVSHNGTITVRKGTSYGQQTYDIYTCLDNKFNFDFYRRGCALLKP